MPAPIKFEVTFSPAIWHDGFLEYMEIGIRDVENSDDVRRGFYLNDGTLLVRVGPSDKREKLSGLESLASEGT